MRKQTNLPLSAVAVNDGFWSGIQSIVQNTVLPLQADILEDREKSHAVENFRIAAGEAEGEFQGMIFQDSDVYKWLEAVSYSLAAKPDQGLNARADEMIRLIGKAQQEDGYINTHFILKEPDRKWSNLRDDHELYCFGHLIEAGVAHVQATGKRNLLNIAVRAADLICKRFGSEKTQGVPGHEEIELALLRLYRVNGKKEYLETARYFIDERGQTPGDEYRQSHLPVREQTEAVGHSVRAMYLYTAMADLAAETNDVSLVDACRTLLDNILQKKMYITGGVGSTFHGEAFSPAYDLPNDTVYAETCASIGCCFFARRMLEIKPDGQMADLIERQIYNTVLASMRLDGKRFFYTNPLEVVPGLSGVAPAHQHILPERPEWHNCACCPPNLSRLILSLGRYAWGEGDGTVYAHLWLGGSARFSVGGGVSVTCESGYPWKGDVLYTLSPTFANAEFCFAVHIPAWCRDVQISLNGSPINPGEKDGYITIKRVWEQGDTVRISAALPVLRTYSHPAVKGNAGQTALQRGPIVYCFEQEDNGAPLSALRLPPDADINEVEGKMLTGMVVLTANGLQEEGNTSALYTETRPAVKSAKLTAIPYFAWGNRSPGEMRVWIRE
ncbi:MAG: glycoside hydrolase family 127 protein [Oscillospiraceae bacterium]|nr:glycoside hydrolase family 127 protein [Oscillospiraceae bacterium]